MYVHSWCAHTPPLVAEALIVTLLLLLLVLSLPTRPPVANQRATTQSQIKGNAHRSRRVARMLLGRFVMRLPAVCHVFFSSATCSCCH